MAELKLNINSSYCYLHYMMQGHYYEYCYVYYDNRVINSKGYSWKKNTQGNGK